MSEDTWDSRSSRRLATALVVCAVATLSLLANHPGGGGHSLAEVITDEARNQFADGLVHGGIIATLSVLIVCFQLLSRRLGSNTVAVTVGLTAFVIGCAAMMASMILDGFATPDMASRFAGSLTPENLATARPLLILTTTLIRFLMPMGLLFQSVATLSWSIALWREGGLARAVALFGAVTAVAMLVGLFAGQAVLVYLLMGGFVVQAVWYLLLALVLFRQPYAA